jgi:hypothetical protein
MQMTKLVNPWNVNKDSPAMPPNIAPPQVNKSLPIRAKLSLVLLEIGTISSNIDL